MALMKDYKLARLLGGRLGANSGLLSAETMVDLMAADSALLAEIE